MNGTTTLKVLVTGGAGYIGSHTCKRLRGAGHVPVVFDNLSTGHLRFVGDRARFVHGDIGDPVALARVFAAERPDAVVHFAASAYVGASVADPLGYYRNNVAGTLMLLEAMANAGVRRLVFSSSCATYGTPATLPIREGDAQRPINPYGATKLVGEDMMRAQAATGALSATALRYFNAAGADPDGELGELHDPETHLIPLMLEAARDPDRPLTVFGTDYDTPDGTCVRDYLHVADLAEAHLLALERLGDDAGVRAYNLGTGTGHSVRAVIDAAERVTGRPVATRMAERRPGDPASLVADPSLALRELGWAPRYPALDTMVGTAWAWMNSPRHPANRYPANH